MRWLACFLGALTMAAGCVLEDKPVDPQFDGGVEAGMCIICPPTTPVCNDDLRCVECTADDDGYCTDQTLVCKTGAFECVECNASSDCDAPDAAHCNTARNECDGCESETDCIGIEGLPLCEDGTCVQCTPATEVADCGGNSCDPATFRCTDTMLASRETCQTCVSDSECKQASNRCVAMTYQDEPYPDPQTGFCLKTFTAGDPCERPYLVPLVNRQSVSGAPAADYCGINENAVTCPAVVALLNDVRCLMGEDSECPDSGLCEDLAGGVAENRCTYSCGLAAQCPADEPANTCGPAGSSGKYCGG
jgi:hypothetical protein